MGDSNFLRRYVLKAGKMGRNGFSIGDTNPHALHIAFSIEKSTSETANTARIQVWNLSPENLKVLDTEDCVIELQAGYESHVALILVGNVVTSVTQADGADRVTEIEVVDGRVALRDTYLSLSYNGKTETKPLFDAIAAEMGISVVYSAGCIFPVLPNGYSFIGAAKDALTKLCQASGLTWSIQNGVLQIRLPNEPVSVKAYLLSPDTGLLDVPKRITLAPETDSSKDAASTNNQIGYEVRYLLNGAIGVNDYVRLESKIVRGYFRVYKLAMDGDNQQGEWTCTAQLLEVK